MASKKGAITFSQKGDFSKTDSFLGRIEEFVFKYELDKYGEKGVAALKLATPKDTGLTSESWKYRVIRTKESASIEWYNTNVQNGINIAVILQYGHGTRNGGYVAGIDYINPAIKPIFEEIAKSAWKEVIGR